MKTTITIEDQGQGMRIMVTYDPPVVMDSLAPMSPAFDLTLAAVEMLTHARVVETPLGFKVIKPRRTQPCG